MISKRLFLTHIEVQNWKEREGHKKNSFWASDCLRPSCDIYWKYIDEPVTNPIRPESLLLMQVGKLYEQKLVEWFEQAGEIVPITDTDRIEELHLKLKGDQFRVEMEREFVPVTGYMDAVHVEGFPIEIKTHWAQGVDSMLEAGMPPNEHYCYQTAVYMDYMGVDRGQIVSANRATGGIWFSEVRHLGDSVYECKGFRFDLGAEYKRWRKIMEDNVIPRKEPALEYFYRPDVTKKLLDMYDDTKIKKAIKGERVLSDHKWRYQYSSFKEKVMEKEADMRNVTVEELCTYTPEDIDFMMAYGSWEFRTDKNGKVKIFKKKVTKKGKA